MLGRTMPMQFLGQAPCTLYQFALRATSLCQLVAILFTSVSWKASLRRWHLSLASEIESKFYKQKESIYVRR